MIGPEVYARAKMPAGPRGEYQPSTAPYRRDQNMNVGIPEIREALRNGSMTRDELAAQFHSSRAVVAKPIYNLIQSGEAIEEGGRISLLPRDLPSKPSEAQESHPSTTQGDQIDSRAVSGAGMGISDMDPGKPEDAGAHDQDLQRVLDDIRATLDAEAHMQRLRDALSLLMAELPALLEDREKLRKLREVLG